MISLTVPGEPVPLPRQRVAVRNGVAICYQPAGPIQAYKQSIALLCRQQIKQPFVGPVAVEVVFRFLALKRKTREYPCNCDLDNCVKAVLDALNGIAWQDDRQVTQLIAQKEYGEPCTRIALWSLQ